MPLDQNFTDKSSVVTAETKTNKKNKSNKNNNSGNNKKFIKKTLKLSKNNKKHAHLTNVNSKNVVSTKNNTNNNNNSNAEVANDEIIEELFDFSDTDLKELDDIKNEQEIISNSNSCSSAKRLSEDSTKLEDNEKMNDECSEAHLQNMTSDNNNNRNKVEEKNNMQQPQVEPALISPSVDSVDKQDKDTAGNNELVSATAPTINNIISAPENVDKGATDKKQQNLIDPIMAEHGEESDLSSNKDDSKSYAQKSNSSFVSDSGNEVDNNDINFATSSDMKPEKTNNVSESSPLIGIPAEGSSSSSSSSNNKNDASEPNNDGVNDADRNVDDDDDDDDADDDNEAEHAEPYDELLVQFLDEANQIAEARLAARRHARAEAREIRMRELERQQKEQESNADRVFDMHSTVTGITPLSHMRLGLGSSPVTGLLNSARGNSMSSRRSSEDSLEEEGRSLRDIRHELKDVEERFRKAMIANAQLDNDRASQTYQIQLLKDKLEDMEESYSQLQRECKEKTRDCNALKRSLDKLNEELKLVQGQLNERDTLITEQGLIIVAIENEDGTDAKRALVSVENAQLLGSVQGSLDVRLKKFTEEKQQLHAEVQQLQEQLETYKSQGKGRGKGSSSNGPLGSDDDDYEAQREANKIISDYKYKLQKAEQEIASLQSSLARSETQVIRYKSTAEAAEKAEAELKIERRKLQRENREAMEKLEELETSNNHLLKRLDKLKNAKSALLKDL